MGTFEGFGALLYANELVPPLHLATVHPRDGACGGLVTPPYLLQGAGHLSYRGPRSSCRDAMLEQIALLRFRASSQRAQRSVDCSSISLFAQPLEAL